MGPPQRVHPHSALSLRHIWVTARPRLQGLAALSRSAQRHPNTDFSLVWVAAECLESWASSVYGSERRAYLSLPETPARGLATALPRLRPRGAPPRWAVAGGAKALGGPETHHPWQRPLEPTSGQLGQRSPGTLSVLARGPGPTLGPAPFWNPTQGPVFSIDESRCEASSHLDHYDLRAMVGRSRMAADSS